jgi:hypothetical protein
MAPPTILSAFLSVTPLEPVLVFSSPEDASTFQSRCKQGRILHESAPNWVYLPLPPGLLRVRTARRGDVAFDFESERAARDFDKSIKGLGRIYENRNQRGERGWEKVVYLGKEKM